MQLNSLKSESERATETDASLGRPRRALERWHLHSPASAYPKLPLCQRTATLKTATHFEVWVSAGTAICLALIWLLERGVCDKESHTDLHMAYMVWFAVDQIHFLIHWATRLSVEKREMHTSPPCPTGSVSTNVVLPGSSRAGSISLPVQMHRAVWLCPLEGWKTARVWSLGVIILHASDSPHQVTLGKGSF